MIAKGNFDKEKKRCDFKDKAVITIQLFKPLLSL